MDQPTVDQIGDLPMLYRSTVPAEYQDANGHLNISGYLVIHNEASWPFMASFGVDEEYIERRRLSIFDLEHHLRYLAEMVTGSPLSVHGIVVARSEKLLHGMFFLVDLGSQQVSNTFEFVSAHVSLESRRSVPFPPEVAEAIDAQVGLAASLDWSLPLSGVLGLNG